MVVAKFATTTAHGAINGKSQTREVAYYNLDMIISVSYRVNSKRGAKFRQWATQRLKEFLVQGYSINQKRLPELGKMVQLIEQSGKAEYIVLYDMFRRACRS